MIDPVYREIPALVEIIVALSTLAGLWWAAVRWVWPKLQATGRALAGLMDLGTRSSELTDGLGRMATMEAALQAVKHEVLPNSGSSLRDAVSRTESTVALIVAQQRARDDAEDEVVRLDLDAEGKVTWLAAALMRWTSRTSDDLRGHGWMSFIAPDEREDVASEFSQCIRHRRQFEAAFNLIDRAGETTMVRMSAVPISIRVGLDSQLRWTATMKKISVIPDTLRAPER